MEGSGVGKLGPHYGIWTLDAEFTLKVFCEGVLGLVSIWEDHWLG